MSRTRTSGQSRRQRRRQTWRRQPPPTSRHVRCPFALFFTHVAFLAPMPVPAVSSRAADRNVRGPGEFRAQLDADRAKRLGGGGGAGGEAKKVRTGQTRLPLPSPAAAHSCSRCASICVRFPPLWSEQEEEKGEEREEGQGAGLADLFSYASCSDHVETHSFAPVALRSSSSPTLIIPEEEAQKGEEEQEGGEQRQARPSP